MIVRGTVVGVELDVTIAKKDGGNYPGARFSYRDDSGKLVEQNFHNNAFKFNDALKGQLKALKAGDVVSITKEKNKNDFWEVKSITKTESIKSGDSLSDPSTQHKPVASPKSTYETAEERAQKQVYIVRQSSLANSIAFFADIHGGKGSAKVATTDVIKVAKEFEAYVFGEEFDDGSVMTMKDDTDGII